METEKLNVNGLAIKPQISRNRVKYTAEELDKFAKTLKGVSIQKDHSPSVDSAVGLVTKSESNKGRVTYEGWIKEDSTNLIEKVKDKRISKVSIGAICGQLVREKEDGDIMIAKDLVAVELSLVVVPGIVGATVKQSLDSIRQNKENSKVKVKPILESFETEEEVKLTEEEIKGITESIEEEEGKVSKKQSCSQPEIEEVNDISKQTEENKMTEEAKKETVAEVKEETTPAPTVDVNAIVEAISKKVKESSDDLKAELSKVKEELNDKIVTLKEELEKEEPAKTPEEAPAEEPEKEVPAEEPAEEPEKEPVLPKEEPEFKSEEPKEELKEEGMEGYCMERTKSGNLSLFRMPNADGSYGKEE